jgi:outer membrane protein assembly factor BamB
VLAAADRGGMQGGQARCLHSGADVGDVLVCVVTEPVSIYQDSAPATVRATARNRVVAVSAADGRHLGEWALPGTVLTVALLGHDVLVATIGSDLFVDIARRDAVSGRVGWQYRSGEAQIASGTAARVEVTPQLVLLTNATSTVLDATDGAVVYSRPTLDYVLTEAVDRRFVTWTTARRGTMRGSTGAPEFELSVFPIQELTNDGSAQDVLVLYEGRLLAGRDPATGRQLWVTATGLNPVLTVDRSLVLAGGGQIGVLDLSSGKLEWSWQVGPQLAGLPLSDGSLVLAPAADGSGRLAAYGLRDGVPYWQVALPADLTGVSAQGGHLLVRTVHEVIALG